MWDTYVLIDTEREQLGRYGAPFVMRLSTDLNRIECGTYLEGWQQVWAKKRSLYEMPKGWKSKHKTTLPAEFSWQPTLVSLLPDGHVAVCHDGGYFRMLSDEDEAFVEKTVPRLVAKKWLPANPGEEARAKRMSDEERHRYYRSKLRKLLGFYKTPDYLSRLSPGLDRRMSMTPIYTPATDQKTAARLKYDWPYPYFSNPRTHGMRLSEDGKLYLWGWSATATSREPWWSPFLWEIDSRNGKLLRKLREKDPMSGPGNNMGGIVADRAFGSVALEPGGTLVLSSYSDGGFDGVCHFSGSMRRVNRITGESTDKGARFRPCIWNTDLVTLPGTNLLAIGRCNFSGVDWTKEAWQENDPTENPQAWLRVYDPAFTMCLSTPIRGIVPHKLAPLSETRFIVVGRSWGNLLWPELVSENRVGIVEEPNPGVALVKNALFDKPRGKDDGYYMIVDWNPGPAPKTDVDLKGADFGGRTQAAVALAAKGAAAVPELTEALKHGDSDARRRAALVLSSMGSNAVPALVEVLKSGAADARRWALVGAYETGAQAGDATPAVAKALKDEDVVIRRYAAYALGRIGPAAKLAAPALGEALKDEDLSVRRYAVRALGAIRPGAGKMVGVLAGALEDVDDEVSRLSVESLAMLGPTAGQAVPALVAASERAVIRRHAFRALGRIGPASLPSLIAVFNDADAGDRDAAVAALGAMGPEAKDAVPALIQALKDKDSSVRSSAAGALRRIGPAAGGALPALTEALKDKETSVRRKAAAALGGIEPEAARALPALRAAIKDDDRSVRSNAVKALGTIGSAAIPALVEALEDESLVRYAAAALGGLGPEAEAAVPALTELAEKGDKKAQKAAARALRSIKGKRK